MINLDEMLLSRACLYGNFNDVSSRTARIYHHMVYGALQFINKNDMSAYYEALHMIAVKIARLVEGQINSADSWLDIAGYDHAYSSTYHHPRGNNGSKNHLFALF